MSIKVLNLYRLYVIEDSSYIQFWSESEPTTHPYDAAKTIDQIKTSILKTIKNDETLITDIDRNFTNGHAASATFQINTDNTPEADGWIDGDLIQFDYNVSIHSARIFPLAGSEGDELEVCVASNTPIGVISEAVPSGQNYLKSNTASMYSKPGFFLKLFSAPSTVHNCGHVLGNGIQGSKVYFKTPPNVEFAVGSVVLMTVKPLKNFQLPSGQFCPFGDDLVGGMNLPSGTVMLPRYKKSAGSSVTGVLRSQIQFRY